LNNIYTHTEDIHNLTSPREIVPIVMEIVKPLSVIDIGCGIGTWLKAFEEHGVTDYLGVDGDFVDRSLLKISVNKFLPQDLQKEWSADRKFHLVLSLEVAEHLPEEIADLFVSVLVSHGDTILFSAAIPGQGGQNHLNEQWPSYWQEKFRKHGFFCHDIIRPWIWGNDKIDWWYRQNIILVSRIQSTKEIPALVHPECLRHNQKLHAEKMRFVYSGAIGVKASFKIFCSALFQKIFG
jgi:hypothetical protein